jgi:hypothetical protein
MREPVVAATMSEPGVPAVPVANVSHVALELAVHPRLVPAGLVIVTVCDAGEAAPTVPEKVSDVGDTLSEGATPTVKVTGTF